MGRKISPQSVHSHVFSPFIKCYCNNRHSYVTSFLLSTHAAPPTIMALFMMAVLSSPAVALATCFPGLSAECCEAFRDAQSDPVMQQAMWGLESASGPAEAPAFAECNASQVSCAIMLPNHTQVSGTCCAADAFKGWEAPGPAAAMLAVLTAAQTTHRHGAIWWVTINQTLAGTTAGGFMQKVISHQYPNWYPLQCNNATALSAQQSMMCHGGSVIECVATVEH
jgi:hypothetical protein